MPNELSSIEGLADKHLRVLARHYVTDLRGLVQADRRVICRAMVNLRPRPTLELISRWQDEARSMLDEVVTDTSEWHTVASFAVIFSQRQREDGWERRAEVERTEVEPERNPQVWPGWDCAPICAWMTGQAEFDLSEVPAGDHQLSLIAWAPDASAKPVSVRLPRITIRDPRGH